MDITLYHTLPTEVAASLVTSFGLCDYELEIEHQMDPTELDTTEMVQQ